MIGTLKEEEETYNVFEEIQLISVRTEKGPPATSQSDLL